MQSLAAMLSLTTSVSSTTVGTAEFVTTLDPGILALGVGVASLAIASEFLESCRSGACVATTDVGESIRMRWCWWQDKTRNARMTRSRESELTPSDLRRVSSS